MPRRLPVRPAKLIGNLFVLFVILVISFIYYVYVAIVWGPKTISNHYTYTKHQYLIYLYRQLIRDGDISFLSFVFRAASMVLLLSNDYRSWLGACVLGFPFRRSWEQKKKILLNVQRIQTRKMSSLFSMQQMCT